MGEVFGFLKNKKGSHIGVMISFLVFVTFLIFLQILLEPALKSNQDRGTLLDGVKDDIINASSSNLKIATIFVEESVTSNCVSIDSFLDDFDFDSRIIVLSEDGNVVDSSLASDSNTLQMTRNFNSENLLKIHSSEVFDPLESGSISCQAIVEGSDYILGISREKNYVFEKKLASFIEDSSNYSKLKLDLGIPEDIDLGIEFVYENGSSINTTEKDVTTNVYVDEEQIDYVGENGKILSGKLRIKIW